MVGEEGWRAPYARNAPVGPAEVVLRHDAAGGQLLQAQNGAGVRLGERQRLPRHFGAPLGQQRLHR